MRHVDPSERRHAAVAGCVALLHAAIFYSLLTQSLVRISPPAEAMTIFAVPPPRPEPPPEERPADSRAPRREGAAAPAALKAKPKPILAPPPKVRVERPPPVVAPPLAADGADTAVGAAALPGPGTGAGGDGTGTGSGLAGAGDGGGGGSGPRWIRGRIRDSDYPRSASAAEVGGTVIAHFDVGTDGRAVNCRVVGSSGNAALDETTCRLIEQRFRYEPATDARGEPVPSVAGWKQDWWLEPRG